MYILIVDDNIASRERIQRILVELGHRGIPCDDGCVAWAALGKVRFDAVIADQDTTSFAGMDLCRKIRAATNRARCTVIISTSAPDQHANQIMLAGADGCLAKPVQKDDLQALVGNLRPSPALPPNS
jgi:CheY-like chemotaxis protein